MTSKVLNYPGITTAIAAVDYRHPTTSFETYAALGMAEEAIRPEVGDHPGCEKCPRNFECLSGAMPGSLLVARTREEQRRGFSLPCIDEGKTRLVVVTDMELALARLDNVAKTLKEQNSGYLPLQPTSEEDKFVWIAAPPQTTYTTNTVTWPASKTALQPTVDTQKTAAETESYLRMLLYESF